MKKIQILSIFTGLIVFSVFLSSSTSFIQNENSESEDNYNRYPPIAESFHVQLLVDTLSNGENLRFSVKFNHEDSLPPVIKLYTDSSTYLSFSDNGQGADLNSGDSIYSCYLKVDTSKFLTEIREFEEALETKDTFIVFEGHEGKIKDSIENFNFIGFKNYLNIKYDYYLIEAADCDDDLVKYKSLFITDLSVVEDDDRTFNCVDETGTEMGEWTFGYLINEIANESITGVSAQNLLKDWLKNFVSSYTDPVSSESVLSRDNIILFCIKPWISKANGESVVDNSITSSNWESKWDLADEDELLKFAPFKLTAIVNRLDLRDAGVFFPLQTNAGETRFVFTLINLYEIGPGGGHHAAGMPPINENTDLTGTRFEDWKGMNVIFEYLNPHRSRCELHDFAQSWLDLSELSFGSSFNTALNSITSEIVDAGVAPNRPNQSALGRIRTNEKVLFESFTGQEGTWSNSNWEFRQFEIDLISHLLEQVHLTNTPISDYNEPVNLDFYKNNNSVAQDALTNWAYYAKNKVLSENFTIPKDFGGDRLLSIGGQIVDEFAFYWDMDYSSSTTYFNKTIELNQNNKSAKELRHKLSVNTCQGCHAGETKTIFTQVAPLGYGQTARYWLTPPDVRIEPLDQRSKAGDADIASDNEEETQLTSNVDNYDRPPSTYYFQNVSAFITGRTYNGSNDYSDDEPLDNLSDNTMDGLFWVNDPSNVGDDNGSNNNFGYNDMKHGFNELQRRKNHLCKFLQWDCRLSDPIETEPAHLVAMLRYNMVRM